MSPAPVEAGRNIKSAAAQINRKYRCPHPTERMGVVYNTINEVII